MDELNVQQLWGISPPLDLETAAKASVQRRATSSCTTTDGRASSTAVLQVGPRHEKVSQQQHTSPADMLVLEPGTDICKGTMCLLCRFAHMTVGT